MANKYLQELRKEKFLKLLSEDDWGDDVPILVSIKARDSLIAFLFGEYAKMGEGYSDFILTAIEMRKKKENQED